MDPQLKKRMEKLIREEIEITDYNPDWLNLFKKEASYLKKILPSAIVKRIEHFGSTAIPGISAKPVIDILVEVTSLIETKKQVVPILKSKGYEYLWRPTIGDKPPFYAWFIKRNSKGKRIHHIHMVEKDSELWDRLFFRDFLREFPKEAKKYDLLKRELSAKFKNDRVMYTKSKTKFITNLTRRAKSYYKET